MKLLYSAFYIIVEDEKATLEVTVLERPTTAFMHPLLFDSIKSIAV